MFSTLLLMSTKKIQYNPNILTSSTTRTKTQKINRPILINETSLKKQLISRIKKHKNTENQERTIQERNLIKKKNEIIIPSSRSASSPSSPSSISSSFSDEFNDSINYLSSISKKHKENNKVRQNQLNNQNKTLRPRPAEPIHSDQIYVDVELPNELKEFDSYKNLEPSFDTSFDHDPDPVYSIRPSPTPSPTPVSSSSISYNVDSQVPYGCLKNGLKPTYKQFTRRNNPAPVFNSPIKPSLIQTDREKRLHNLKQKYNERKYIEESNKPLAPVLAPTQAFKPPVLAQVLAPEVPVFALASVQAPVSVPVSAPVPVPVQVPALSLNLDFNKMQEPLHVTESVPVPVPIQVPLPVQTHIPISVMEDIKPKLIKKTIRRKYTLGKSNIYRKVSVLIKNNETRKKIMIAQKELKKKSIYEIKKYLKDHFLLKSGSSAPNDVLRKIYESVMLSGNITNNNKETILHNFMNKE